MGGEHHGDARASFRSGRTSKEGRRLKSWRLSVRNDGNNQQSSWKPTKHEPMLTHESQAGAGCGAAGTKTTSKHLKLASFTG